MADLTLIYLSSIAVLLFIGIICSIISNKIRIPNVLLLILTGIVFANISYRGSEIIIFPPVFLTSIAILALIMIVFDSTSKIKLKEFDTFSLKALEISVLMLVLNLTLLSGATYLITGIDHIFILLLFSTMMSGTDPAVVLTFLKGKANKVTELLEIESIMNTPLTVLIPFLLLDLLSNVQATPELHIVAKQFSLQLVAGIGTGILVGIIIFKVMKKQYSETISPVAIITAALLTYILAENLDGNGVLAVTTLGLFFGTAPIKEKSILHEFSTMFANSLEILVFILVGFIITIPLTVTFFAQSLTLFAAFLFIRWISINISLKESPYNFKEKLFIALNAPKGIAVATIAFTLTTFIFPGVSKVLNLALAFLLYSILLSTLLMRFSRYFIRLKI